MGFVDESILKKYFGMIKSFLKLNIGVSSKMHTSVHLGKTIIKAIFNARGKKTVIN